jgi:hypothetical protein
MRLESTQTEGSWIWDDTIYDFVWIPREIQTRKVYIKFVDEEAKTVTLKYKGAVPG